MATSKKTAAPTKTAKKTTAAAPAKTVKKAAKPEVTKTSKKIVAPVVKSKKTAAVEKTPVKKSSKTTAAPAKTTKTVAKTKPAATRAPRGSHFDITPIKNRLGKTELINTIAENCELEPRVVKKVMAQFEQLVLGSIMKKGAGEFMWPGIAKIVTKHIPAQKGGVKKPNPFKPGEMMVTKAKPATVRVRVRALAKLKKAAVA